MIKRVLFLLAFIFPLHANALVLSPGFTLFAGGEAVANASLATASTTAAAVWAPVLFGASVKAGYMAVGWIGDQAGVDSIVRIPLTSAATPIPAPSAPVSASLSGGVTIVGDPSAQLCNTDPTCGTYQPLSQCLAGYGAVPTRFCKVSVSGVFYGLKNYSQPIVYPAGVTDGAGSCPAGYVVSGVSCALSNPRLVTSDGKKDLTRTGTAFTLPISANDIDVSLSAPMKGTIGTDGSYQLAGTDSAGNLFQLKVTPTTNGGSTVQYKQQTVDSVSNTSTTTQTFTVDSAANITSAVQTSAYESLTVDPATQTATVTTTGTGTPTAQASQQAITFPSDYARTGEAATAAQPVTNAVNAQSAKLDTLHHDLTDTVAAPADLAVPSSSQFEDAFFKGTFTNLLAWRLPVHAGICPTAVFDYNLFGSHQHLVMDAQCTIAESVRSVLSTVMIVVFTIVALFLVLGA